MRQLRFQDDLLERSLEPQRTYIGGACIRVGVAEGSVRHQNYTLVTGWRMTCDGHDVRTHLVDVHLAEAFLCKLAVESIECIASGHNAGLGIDAIAPFLVLAGFVDHVDLQKLKVKT